MKIIKPVTIKNSSFNTCKYGISILIWAAFIFKLEILMYISAALLLASAVLGVGKSPLIILGDFTVSKIFKSQEVMLDENGMRFAHSLGFILVSICLILLLFDVKFAWYVVLGTAILKTVSAVGYCSGLKLYQCINSDDCCKISSTVKKVF